MGSLKYIFILLLILVAPKEAIALDMDFYTYSGFDAMSSVLQFTALVFSDGGYETLFFVIITLGIFLAGAGSIFKGLMGAEYSLNWTFPLLVGVVIFLGLIRPTSTIYLYDPVLNKNQAIGGIPDGIVLIMGTLNVIERGFVDIIDTAAPIGAPSYKDGAGGIGFQFLLNAHLANKKISDAYVLQSLMAYTEDCLFFELLRPGSTLSANDMKSNSTDFRTDYAKAASPAINTAYYSESHHGGETVTCETSWSNLDSVLVASTTYDDMVDAVCAAGGVDPSDTNQKQRCLDIWQDYAEYTDGSGSSIVPSDYMRQVLMAETLDSALKSVNPDVAVKAKANQDYITSGISAGMVANEYVPIMRVVLLALTIALIPFLAIFIPTPLYSNALKTIIGFFVFNTAFGVSDAITFQMGNAQAYKVFLEVRQNSIAFDAMMTTPTAAMKSLAMFGYMRSAGILLAMVLTKALMDFGGHAFASLGGSIMGGMQGAASGAQSVTAAGNKSVSSAVSGFDGAVPLRGIANDISFQDRNKVGTLNQMSKAGGAMGYGDAGKAYSTAKTGTQVKVGQARGNQDLEAATGRSIESTHADMTAKRTAAEAGHASNITIPEAGGYGKMRAGEMIGALNALNAVSGGNAAGEAEKMAAWNSLDRWAGKEQADRNATELGLMRDTKDGGLLSEKERADGLSGYAQFLKGGGVVDEKMASHLNSKYGTNLVPGVSRVTDIAYDKSGNIAQMDVSSRLNSEQGKAYADWMGKAGHTGAAVAGMRALANSMTGDETMQVTTMLGRGGALAYSKATHGGETKHMNTYGRDSTTTTKDGLTKAEGYIKDNKQLDQMRKSMEAMGGDHAKRAANLKTGMAYNTTSDSAGNLLKYDFNKGGVVGERALTKTETGSDKQEIDRDMKITEKGERSWIGNKNTVEESQAYINQIEMQTGFKADGQSSYYSASTGNNLFFAPAYDKGRTADGKDGMKWTMAQQISAGMVAKEEGIDQNSLHFSVEGGWVAKVGGKTETISKEKVDTRAVEIKNLLDQQKSAGSAARVVQDYVKGAHAQASHETFGPENAIDKYTKWGTNPEVNRHDRLRKDLK